MAAVPNQLANSKEDRLDTNRRGLCIATEAMRFHARINRINNGAQMQPIIGATIGLAALFALVAVKTATPSNPDGSQGRSLAQADTSLIATLTSTEQVGRAGPPRGTGAATLSLRPITNEVCYNVIIRGITGTAAHIHKGAKGENGPVAVPFAAPKDSTSTGCAKVEAMLLTDIGTNPTAYYINVHTADFPQGAIRGQLGKPLGGRGGMFD